MHQADVCDEAACRFCGHCLLWIRRRLYVIVAGGPINLTRLLGMRSQTTSWPLSSNTKKRVARHGYLSTQEYPRNEQDVTQQSTLVVLEDDLPCIRLDSMIIGTIEMVLIEVRYILNNYHNMK